MVQFLSRVLYFVLIFFFMSGCAVREHLWIIAPSALPHTERTMKAAGFWIGRHPSPDRIVLTPSEITDFNLRLQTELKLTRDIFAIAAPYPGENLKDTLQKNLDAVAKGEYYAADGRKAARRFFSRIKTAMAFDTIPAQIGVRYGLIVHYADQRVFPTDEPLYEVAGDIDFDELQNSSLDIGTPVAALHQSADGVWLYVESAASDGWVKAETVAFGDKEAVQSFQNNPQIAVASAPKASIFLDQAMTRFYDDVQMSTVLPLAENLGTVLKVTVPQRNPDGQLTFAAGYLAHDEAEAGYLPYTARTIITQAFKLLNAPYGWGGMYGEQDCSRFLQEIFGTVGLQLPRNSGQQARVGRPAGEFDAKTTDGARLKSLAEAAPGITILPLSGHIMLFLGTVDGRPYAIHATWAYREPRRGRDVPRVLNRVVVSDLFLGDGSKKGSLLHRLRGVVAVK